VVLLPVGGATVESGFGVDLVNQDVAAVAGLDHGVGGDGVAADDDRSVGSIESVAESVLPGAV